MCDDAVDHVSPARAMYTPFSMASRRPRVGLNVGAIATAPVCALVSALLAPADTCRMLWVMVLLSLHVAGHDHRGFSISERHAVTCFHFGTIAVRSATTYANVDAACLSHSSRWLDVMGCRV